MKKWLVGVDEVGRGPLAGPVAVGVAVVPVGFEWTQILGVTDSKKLTETKREEIYRIARALQKAGKLRYEVSMVSAAVIDRIGIVPAITLAMNRALKKLEYSRPNTPVNWSIRPTHCRVRLDGGLRAPERYLEQETIIKGDSKEQVIGLASIMAKVTRDRYMTRLAKQAAYQPYDFATHKGYGTKAHRAAIAHTGLSPQHRSTFCKNVKVL